MRIFTLLAAGLLALPVAGCDKSPPAEQVPPGNGTTDDSADTPGGGGLDVDVGEGGEVDVTAEPPGGGNGIDVDVDPGRGVDIDVGEGLDVEVGGDPPDAP